MAQQVRKYQFTITAGTAKSSPLTQQISFPPMVVNQINIKVPPGPAGNMGFAIGSSGQAVIPNEVDTWIVTDDEYIEFPLEGFWDSGSWELFGYNDGVYDHTIYLTFLLSLVGTPSTTPASPIPSASLSGTPSSTLSIPTIPTATPTPPGVQPIAAPLPSAPPPTAPTITAPPVIAPAPTS